jgi:hypothetical protein
VMCLRGLLLRRQRDVMCRLGAAVLLLSTISRLLVGGSFGRTILIEVLVVIESFNFKLKRIAILDLVDM